MDSFDLLIIGGGINGAAIAREAAMRRQSVLLVEKDDLAQHTSSASSKLIHGGLRYLEQGAIRLVRESLAEREILLRTAPHIVRPLAFVVPDGKRPWWLVRFGLALYDLLAGSRSSLPRAHAVRADETAVRTPLKRAGHLAIYHDAWVDDARLVVLNAVAAAERGAQIATRTALLSAERQDGRWRASLSDGREVEAGALVNAAGPWVAEVIRSRLRANSASGVRLIKGSHIVVPRLYEGDHAYLLQQPDGRVVFALPYGEHNLIGTTDIPVDDPAEAQISAAEIDYLCAAANLYFVRQTRPEDLAWSYSGVRALYDDGAASAQTVTRDYRLELDEHDGAPLLSIFGGKLTTARALAEEAVAKLGRRGDSPTRTAPLPGGETGELTSYDWLERSLRRRLATAYGARLPVLLDGASSTADLGRHFGAGLYEREVDYLVRVEFARTAEDVLWRRTKLGSMMTSNEQAELAAHLAEAHRTNR